MKLTLRRQGHTNNRIVVLLEQLLCHTMNHAINEDFIGFACVDLLGPRATLIILRRIPEGSVSCAHKEEHTRCPRLLADTFHDAPELIHRCYIHNANVTLLGVVGAVGVMVPQNPGVW